MACRKRWLVSIDFGLSEPDALAFLAELPSSEVRIPNGVAVLAATGFRPPARVFHPKLYAFGQVDPSDAPLGILVGSANLTLSGLSVGSEVILAQAWTGKLSPAEQRALTSVGAELRRFDIMWRSADPLDRILPSYRRRRIRRQLGKPPEETTTDAQLFEGTAGSVVAGEDAIVLAKARALWVEVGELYHNLGRGHPGNQVDLQRGTRVFFGFPPIDVPRNTVFGTIIIRVMGFLPTPRTMRFGNNMMDKINLPIPGRDGPDGYDHTILWFEKEGIDERGRRIFRLDVLDTRTLRRRLSTAAVDKIYEMAGGRRYGLVFS